MVDTINKLLLPTRVRVEYDLNPNTSKLERICYVECKNGELLTGNVPWDWANYICSSLNKKHIHNSVNKYVITDPIAVLRIDGLPLTTAQYKGGYAIKEDLDRLVLVGEELFMERWTQLPIDKPISIACTFNVSGKEKYILPLCNAWVLEILYGLGIIKQMNQHIVKTMDGSSIKYNANDNHTLIVIREWRDTNANK